MLRCLLACLLVATVSGRGCYKPSHSPSSVVKSPMPHSLNLDLPKAWDWRRVNGTVFTTRVGTQLQPRPCGSCWAFGSTGALSDRFKIATKGSVTDINLAVQVMLDCGIAYGAGSCDGGDDQKAYEFIYNHGITDETCLPYVGVDFSAWGENPCEQQMCRTCDRFGTCSFINSTKYFVSEYGTVMGEQQMMAEVFARGPIACSLWAHSDSFEKYTGGIIQDPTVYPGTTHVIAIVGFGEEKGVPYWIGRNSFGTYWGEKGFFRLARGNNTLNLENHRCSWAVPHPASVGQMMSEGL